jgi:hypothetical protein
MKLNLLTDATEVDDAMRFVSEYSNNNSKNLISKEEDNSEECKEPDYEEKNSDRRGEDKQEKRQQKLHRQQIQFFDYYIYSLILGHAVV